MAEVTATNEFQRGRLGTDRIESFDELAALPFTTKDELLHDQAVNSPFGSNLTYDLDRYTHVFQTSGTTASPLKVLETADDWTWWRRCFGRVLQEAGLDRSDRIAIASSFGPYVQFWASYEGVQQIDAMAIPLGGMDSAERLEIIATYGATSLLCTPSYALHLARRAVELDLPEGMAPVGTLICTGEPGGSLPSLRSEIETVWGARCWDHAGLTEVGSFSYPCRAGGGIHLYDDEFLFEVVDPVAGRPVRDGAVGELVVTALGRTGFPAIRYRTGDAIRVSSDPCPAGHAAPWLPEGIIGRTDDMVVIRGMNVFPSAIEQVLREVGRVGEFRITFYSDPQAMDEVKVEVELETPADARQIQSRLRARLGLRVRIVPIKPGILPATQGKARRVADLRPRSILGSEVLE